MVNLIDLPRHPKRYEGDTGDNDPCIICGRPMKDKNPKFLHLVDRDGLQVVPPDVEYKDGGTDLCYHPVGRGCLKKYPELRLYAVKRAGDAYEPVSRTCQCGERPYTDRVLVSQAGSVRCTGSPVIADGKPSSTKT